MSSHNALRFKLSSRHHSAQALNKSEQHGGVRECKYAVRNSQLSEIRYISKDDYFIRPFGQDVLNLFFVMLV